MNIEKSIIMLEALSKGFKYDSGEVILEYNNKEDYEIINAIKLALDTIKNEHYKKNKIITRNNKNNKPDRSGMPWSKEEDVGLCSVFDDCLDKKMDLKDIVCKLAVVHERTLGAIVSRLKKLNKIPNNFYINAYMKKYYNSILNKK